MIKLIYTNDNINSECENSIEFYFEPAEYGADVGKYGTYKGYYCKGPDGLIYTGKEFDINNSIRLKQIDIKELIKEKTSKKSYVGFYFKGTDNNWYTGKKYIPGVTRKLNKINKTLKK